MHGPAAIAGYYDVFPFGLGLDLAGAMLLAKGLFTRPSELARRMIVGRNTFSRFNVRAAEDRADVIGVAVLFSGFIFQGLGYVLYIGGAGSHTGGWDARVIAIGFLLAGLAVGLLIGGALRQRTLRRYLVEVARYDDFRAEPYAYPLSGELRMYADILGCSPNPGEYVGPELTGNARRYWKVQRVRTMRNSDD